MFIKGYNVEDADILYQFYERFGFTDVCIHTRSYFVVNDFVLTKDWKRLPLSKKDINRINSIPNKVDTLNGASLNAGYRFKNYYSDISLDRMEFLKDTIFERKIDLTDGYYRVNKNSFEIYSRKAKAIYYEYHDCDGS